MPMLIVVRQTIPATLAQLIIRKQPSQREPFLTALVVTPHRRQLAPADKWLIPLTQLLDFDHVRIAHVKPGQSLVQLIQLVRLV